MAIQKRFYRQYGEYGVYVVNGEAVRDLRPEGDEEFGEWSIHVYFPKMIPENEIWLEDDLPESEYPFVLANAFTRIGRLVFRAMVEQGLVGKDVQVVAVGDIVPADNLAYLLKYDSTQGRFQGSRRLGEVVCGQDGGLTCWSSTARRWWW